MNMRFFLLGMLILMAACNKEEDKIPAKKSVTELLIQKAWILIAHGFDDNDNGVIDQSENRITDCEKDNSYVFNSAGTGSYNDNGILCGGPDRSDFAWKLVNGDTKLEIELQTLSILRLSENELMISPDLPGLTVKYSLVYGH